MEAGNGVHVFESKSFIKGFPTQYMNTVDAKLKINGVVTYDDILKLDAAGFEDVTSKYTPKASALKLLRSTSTGLTYLGIIADAVILGDNINDPNIRNAEKMNNSIMFSLKTAAAYGSTRHPIGAALYFTFLISEYGANEQSKIIKKQGGIMQNQQFPYEIVPGLGPVPKRN